MSIKKKRKYISRAGIVFVMLAFIPTLLLAIKRILEGKYGEPGYSFKHQPLYPVMTVIVIGIVMVLLPIAYFKKELKRKK